MIRRSWVQLALVFLILFVPRLAGAAVTLRYGSTIFTFAAVPTTATGVGTGTTTSYTLNSSVSGVNVESAALRMRDEKRSITIASSISSYSTSDKLNDLLLAGCAGFSLPPVNSSSMALSIWLSTAVKNALENSR